MVVEAGPGCSREKPVVAAVAGAVGAVGEPERDSGYSPADSTAGECAGLEHCLGYSQPSS